MLLFTFPSWLIAQSVWAVVAFALILIAWAALNLIRLSTPLSTQNAREPGIFAGIMWLIFVLYEQQMQAVVAPIVKGANGATGFRLDLIVLVPILYILTGFAIWALLRDTRKWWAGK